MLFDKDFAEFRNRCGFGGREAARSNNFADFFDRDMAHFFRCVSEFEEGGSDEVDAHIGALCGEKHGDQQGVRAGMIERNGSFRIKFLQSLQEVIGTLLFSHARKDEISENASVRGVFWERSE